MQALAQWLGVYIGILGLYWGYIGIMEKKMETTVVIIGIHSLVGGLGLQGLEVRGKGLSEIQSQGARFSESS